MSSRKTPNVGYIRPDVQDALQDWVLVEDCVAGSRQVKSKGEVYLPKIIVSRDATENEEINKKYRLRAQFFNVTGRTRDELVGEVFIKDTEIELPSAIELMEGDVDGSGTTFEQQAKDVLGNVLASGRAGLLVDFPRVEDGEVITRADLESGEIRPKILQYTAPQIINWTVGVDNKTGHKTLDLLTLKEMAEVGGDEFEKKYEPRYRVYRRQSKIDRETGANVSTVTVEVWREMDHEDTIGGNEKHTEYGIVESAQPVLQYDQTPFRRIPFVFIGSKNNDETIDAPPLLDLAILNVGHYRNSADVEWAAFNEGQTTLAITGLSDEWVKAHMANGVFLGSGNALLLPVGGDAKLLQANPATMSSELMKLKVEQMKAIGGRLIEPNQVEKTAFEAGLDKTGQVSILSSVANNVASAYEQAFTFAERFLSDPSESAEVTLNTQYDFGGLSPSEFIDGYFKGLFSFEEVRENARRKGAILQDDTLARSSLGGDNDSL